MSASNQLIKKTSNENFKNELSDTQKFIILASLSQEKKKILINSFDNIPIVKLYTASLDAENFLYSNIRGALCFLYEQGDNKKNYYFYHRIIYIHQLMIIFLYYSVCK